MRDSLIFYKSFYEAIKELPRDVQGEIYTAIMEYGLYGSETEQLKPIARSIFSLIKPQLDANNKRYENGCKGGRPVVEENQPKTNQKPNNNQAVTKGKPNDNVNDNVNDNDNEKELKRDTDVSPESPDPQNSNPINPDFPEKEGPHPPVAPPPLPDPDFLKFQKWIQEKAPQVAKMKEPFTEEEYLRIKEEFSGDMTAEVLLAMHNCKDLLKKYVSANLTFRNWINRRLKDGTSTGRQVHEVITDPRKGDFSDDI